MSRPSVAVVMPYGGDAAGARAAADSLLSLATNPGDELILADNSGVAPDTAGITIVRATGERSPARARNAGAARAAAEWILFLDADCRAPRDLLDAYFRERVASQVGALAGEVAPAPGADSLAARYGAARSFLRQEAHLNHPYRPRAVAANLLVRRAAFEQIGGFFEGVRAAEDTDFSWRLQEAGWRLELRREARVLHRYRTTVRELRRQWRGYAAGRAWLARRYEGFEPEPAVRRVLRRARFRRATASPAGSSRGVLRGGRYGASADRGRLERGRQLALDVMLSAEELAGLTLSNRPSGRPRRGTPEVVLIADRFPARGDPLVEFAQLLDGTRVEAGARPEAVDPAVARALQIVYREDDGAGVRLISLLALIARHPLRCLMDAVGTGSEDPPLRVISPAVRRLAHDADARLVVLGGGRPRATAQRIARLAGRPLEEQPPHPPPRPATGELATRR